MCMLCYVMLCYVMLCCVVLCYVVLCCVVLCYVVLCCVVLCCVVWCGVARCVYVYVHAKVIAMFGFQIAPAVVSKDGWTSKNRWSLFGGFLKWRYPKMVGL